MPRPKTNPASPYDLALRFMGSEPRDGVMGSQTWLNRQDWFDRLSVATDAIAYALKELEKEKKP